MKNTNEKTLQTVIAELENYFSKLNDRFFDGKLEKPVITVSPDTTSGAYGWCTVGRVWKSEDKEDKGSYEINICAEHLTRSIEDTIGTLLHEMVHLYNTMNGIKDCSRGGTYHNGKFKTAAESHGLKVEKSEKYGWSRTTLNDGAKAFVKAMNPEKITFCRDSAKKGTGVKKQSSRKYVCPCCMMSVRATKEVRIACLDCGVPMIEEI